jgi:hypothetical protein
MKQQRRRGAPADRNCFIGRRPFRAFGNSDGDLQMPQWTAAGSSARFTGIVHHTDAEREHAYDRQSHIGHLDKALDEGTTKRWSIADMKKDWRTIVSEPRYPIRRSATLCSSTACDAWSL